MTNELELFSAQDRVALLKDAIAVLSVRTTGRGTLVWVTAGRDPETARDLVAARIGPDAEVLVCGDTPREVRPWPCVGHMEREERRLQLRYVLSGDQHIDDIVVAEDDETVVVFGTVCVSVIGDPGDQVECPAHVWLRRPLGDRAVIDAFTGEPIPYKNVWVEIQRRMDEERQAHAEEAD